MKILNKKWLLVCATVVLSSHAFCQQAAYESPAGTKFLLYTPPGYNSSNATFPLLLSLHSKGETSNDIEELTSKNPEQMPCRLIYLNKWPLDLPFIVLTPQLKPDPNDPEIQWSAEYIDEVVRYVLQHYRVDLGRIYVTGISRGGTGSWTYATAYPEKVAALLPLSGRSDTTKACVIKNIPTWAFHGDGDTVAPPEYSITMVNSMIACQPTGSYKPRLTLIEAHGHNGWNEVYNGTSGYRVFEWLLQFRKNDLNNKKPYVSAGRDLRTHQQAQPFHLYGDYFDWDGTVTNITWKQVSGPSVTLGNTHDRFLRLLNLQTGLYEFQLTVTDNIGAVSFDNVVVEVTDPSTAPAITGITLINGKSNAEIGTLSEEQVINKTVLGLTEINLRATPSDGTGSVLFSINSDQNSRIVNSPGPYYLKNPTTTPEWKVRVGEYQICATAYAQQFARGIPGVSKCFKVFVTEGTAPACSGTGMIRREVWTGVSGKLVSSIPVTTNPTSVSDLNILEAPYNVGDNYGARIRGYVCPPVSGVYTFWISSDDNSELWISSDASPANKVKIASVTGSTLRREWQKYSSQKSAVINLSEGNKYYIEVLHKEGTGYDHVEVGWQLPDGTFERPIPGSRLIPFTTSANQPPAVTVTSPENNSAFAAPASINISANGSDSDGNVSKVEFFNGSIKLGEDLTAPYAFLWSNVQPGNYNIMAKATDDKGAYASASVNISVTSTTTCTGSGTILREVWTSVTGKLVSYIPLTTAPNSTEQLTIFEGPYNVGDNYGARISGLVCPPITGNYIFWISSDDHSELWLSIDNQQANKKRIAYLAGSTSRRNWTAFATQQSAPINLVAGNNYYIEALHKEGTTYDHIAVGWQLPGGVLERPIPGNRLSPALVQTLSANNSTLETAIVVEGTETDYRLRISPNPGERRSSVFTVSGLPIHEVEGSFSVDIIDMTGVVVYSEKRVCEGSCESIVVNPELSAGLYVLKVFIQGKMYSARLMVR
jgi:hypothetical protein